MKKNLLLLILYIIPFCGVAQFICLTNDSISLTQESSVNCNRIHPIDANDSNLLISNYIPNDCTPIKTIRINFNIWRLDDGTGNYWLDLPEYRDTLQMIIDNLNYIYSTNVSSSDPIQGAVFISDTRVRFEIDSVYYINNSNVAFWTNVDGVNNYMLSLYPERGNNFNYHLNLADGPGGASGASNGYSSDRPAIITYYQREGITTHLWGFAIHMAHEFGHNFGLNHSYSDHEVTLIDDPEFLWDLFGTETQSWCEKPPTHVCSHDANWNCEPFDPSNTCTNNIMGGSYKAGHFTALQCGRIHRALAVSTMRKYAYGYSSTPLVISKNTTWDVKMKIYQDIVIDSSSSLTVTCTIEMVPNASIIVRPGSKLILDGGTLTNACDGELWGGIFVEGDPSDATQSENNQGVVELLNGATIENSVCAINLGLQRPDEPQTYLANQGGGIVRASNASFINNLQAIEFGPYRRHKIIGSVHLTRNASNFSHCNFIVNNQALFDLNEFEQHINLIDVEDIQFHSCHFTSLNNKGIAIQSLMSASFSLDDGNMLTSERSNISDFDIGILIQDGKPSYVYNTNFNNNFTGILTEKSDAIYIAGNHFQIPYESYHGPTCGVSLTNCPYFYIKNNIFHGEINCNYGLIINHSGKNDNIIKNNMFTHLRIANLAFGENSDGLNGIKGLQFHCNWFENNDQDIVVSDYDIETGSIRYIQGELGMGCGNIFTDNGFSLTSDNYSFQYHYKNNSHRENPFHVPLNIQTVANDDHLCNQIGLENPLIAPPEVPFNWQNTLYDYYNLISTSLENTKRSYQERGYYDIPIDWYMYFNEEVIPDELAHQVSLYYEMTNLQSQLSGICQTALYCIYNDSLFNTSLYHDWLIRTHTPETDYLLAESYYENGNFNECFQIINAIPGSYEGYNEIENQNYLSYYNLKEYLRINEMTWSDLEEESAEKSQLFDIASSGINEAACVARAIVNSFFDVSYEPLIQPNFLIDLCMYIINLNNDSSLIPINDLFEEPKQNNYTTSIDQIPEKENSLTIYPNPASTLLTINNGNQIIREISLCDVLGKEIKTYTINASKTDLTISHLNKGFYFLRILTDKGMVNKSFVKE
ncbi:MAG: T9SS type A sorting domain-containing protein [Bacteroidales bacterium]|nr:T9SS type A sorting domain-containing protein [Bacteroidales bacterium]